MPKKKITEDAKRQARLIAADVEARTQEAAVRSRLLATVKKQKAKAVPEPAPEPVLEPDEEFNRSIGYVPEPEPAASPSGVEHGTAASPSGVVTLVGGFLLRV